MKKQHLGKTYLALSLCAVFQPALANQIETIEVTADFRGDSIEDIASSVAVVSLDTINTRQAQHLEEIINVAPNVTFASGAGRGRFVQIRGIGERSQFAEPINPSVGFIIDDMDFSGTVGIATLFDIEQVEVLNGPRGTAFGASAMAGLIKLKTVDPSKEASGRFKAGLAQNNTWELAGAYGDSLSDDWQYRVAVQQFKSDGFIENSYLDRDDTDNIDEFSSRLKLRYQPNQEMTMDLSYQFFDIDNGYDAFSLDNDRKTRSDEPGFDRQQTHAFGINTTWQESWGSIQTVLTYNDSDIEYGYDEDWTFVGFHPDEYSSVDEYFRNRENKAVDVRIMSNASSKLFADSTSWLLGVYLRDTNESLLRQYTYDDDFTSEYSVVTYAAYGQFETTLSDKLTLVSGLRVETNDIDYRDNREFSDVSDDTLVGGKLVLEYDSETFGLLYAGVHRGYKLGGFNPDQRIENEHRLFDAEYNWNYEIGLKQFFLDKRLFVGVSAFYMDRKDTQISDFTTLPIEGSEAVSFVDVIANADLGTNYGLELQTQFEISPSLNLFTNLGLLNAEFENYTNAKGEYIEKQDQAQSPDYTFNVRLQSDLSENLRLNIEADGKGEHRFSDGHDELSPSYVLWHANLSYQLNDWQLSLWAKNLFDKTYFVRGFGGFNNDPRDGYFPEEPYYQLGDGRQVGISADYRF
ncbi:TonB-dependent receptor [Alteromonas sp. a30]|uniref:TonB-dependent receptor n=1 Tax=Alteromonas sp. a30 TaxID=2730917 RepID=UPI002281DBDB|nr:TonB-dependent receptor [Alteromonas sp. a30]MCY7296660.1 TonB-dependent receptor [Alteromonas sp. a30]